MSAKSDEALAVEVFRYMSEEPASVSDERLWEMHPKTLGWLRDRFAVVRREAKEREREACIALCHKQAERIKHTSHADGLGMGNQSAELACADVAALIQGRGVRAALEGNADD